MPPGHNASDLPTISAIVPVHDGARYLAQALESILRQELPVTEILVVDDGSTDASAAIASRHERVRVIRQECQGHAAARNTGIRAARGALLAFLDADDTWTPDKLSIQVPALLASPEAGYSTAGQRLVLEPGVECPGWLDRAALESVWPAPIPSTLLVRRETFDLVGEFDSRFRITCDTAWQARAMDLGVARVVLREALVWRRIHADNQSHAVAELQRELLGVLRESAARKRQLSQATGAPPPVRVSVVVPAYNAGRYLTEALESVLAQLGPSDELIAVDDGSTDDTRAILAAQAHRVRYSWQPNGGVAAAVNRGLELATGEFLAFCDADDVWLPSKLACQLAALDAAPSLDGVFGHVVAFGTSVPLGAVPVRGVAKLTLLIRRQAFDRVGPFDPTLRIGDFVEWHARAMEGGLRFGMLPEVVARRRLHETNTGIVDRHLRSSYTDIVKQVLDRRRRDGRSGPA